MGIFISCCRPSASEVITPDVETRRMQQAQAAERRRVESEARGVKDPERVKRMQQRSEEMERHEKELEKKGGPNLRSVIDVPEYFASPAVYICHEGGKNRRLDTRLVGARHSSSESK
ncbi:hypothetical protein EVAR_77734_1 [Eumeta japonica]|uniref:Uncharacterized protein n=1 Tax=Eumeta variegata TaxID=151549 RepID=A0A4C1TDX0_EUMVA|nr:hypothetical protein EVAR_77734_1 [Eumeta japonica]